MSIRETISRKPWIMAVMVALGVIAWLASGAFKDRSYGEGKTIASAGTDTDAPVRVQVRAQRAEPVTRFISVYGRTTPARSVELNAETDGRVELIAVERGQRVAAGDLLLRLDMRDRRARVEQANASVREHRTAYQAQLRLKGDGYVSDTQLTETLARLEAAKAELVRAKLDLENRNIRAPFAGVLKEREVEIGGYVRAGDSLGTIVDDSSLVVTGSIAEQDARYVAINKPATAVLVTGQQVTGRIRYVSPVADDATRTFDVELEVENPDGSLPAGVTAEMRLDGGTVMAQKVSPALLTLDSDGQIGIKVVDTLNRVEFYPVEIARSESTGVWITGLPDSANVITSGQGYVSVGQQVEPVYPGTDTALAAESTQ